MKRLVILATVLVMLTALLGSCGGGGEEAGVLALAFRLDEGYPVMVAYAGDPAEDPFQPLAGRYYIEALDRNDVVVSLGAVDIEPGEVVDIPSSLAAAGGVADAERAEPVVTIASFLVDAELADYALLEIVTGGFELPPFDPAVQIAAADVERLFAMHSGILAQEEDVMAGLAEIERRAVASSGVPYLRSGRAPVLQEPEESLEKARERLAAFFAMIAAAQGRAEESANPDEALASVILDLVEQQNVLEAQLAKPVAMVQSTPDLSEKSAEWRKYAQNLAKKIPTSSEEAGRQQAQQELAGRIKKDLQDWLNKRGVEVTASHVDAAVDPLAEWVFEQVVEPAEFEPAWIGGYVTSLYDQWRAMGYDDWDAAKATTDLRECLREEVAAGANRAEALARCPPWHYEPKGTPAATATATPAFTPVRTATATAAAASPTPEETATPAPDTGWIEGYVQGIADQWLAAGYGGIDVAVAADDLRNCLTAAVVELGRGRDEAIGECPLWLYEPEITPSPTKAPTEELTQTPAPEPTETPAPQPMETPTPEPTQTPAPPGQQVTATGQLTDLYDPSKITANSITLRFNTEGGSVSGEAHFEKKFQGSCATADWQYIDGTIVWTWDVVFSGTYTRETGQLDGTAQITFRLVTCQRGASWSEPWSATLQGTKVVGRFIEDCEWVASLHVWPTSTPECLPGAEDRFELTVQGP